MARKPIPENVWQKIRNDWGAGVPITTIADAYGVSKQTIYNKKTQEQWDLPLTRTEASIKKAQGDAERIAALLEGVVGQIEGMEESPQKMLHALKTASDVASTLQKNERRTWGMDEKQGVSSLEDFLDKADGKLTVINGAK